MNLRSVNIKLSLAFVISLVLLVGVLLAYLQYEEKQHHSYLHQKYKQITDNFHKERMSYDDIVKFVKSYQLEQVVPSKKFRDKAVKIASGRGFGLLKYEDNIYLHFHTPHFRVLFKDLTEYEKSYLAYLVFIIILSLITSVYVLILKNIRDTKLLLSSRQLFLRTVMHEIKTPIAKGRIVSELIDDEKQKKRIITLFSELNNLVDEMSRIEQIISKNYTFNRYIYDVNELLLKAIDKLMLENTDNIILEKISSRNISVDIELFSMSVKNLIDNGLKYSTDKKIIIKSENNALLFISKGSKLEKPFEDYFQPFHNDTNAKNHGMGLGLYIVKSILDLHGYGFRYKYKDGSNIFKIIF